MPRGRLYPIAPTTPIQNSSDVAVIGSGDVDENTANVCSLDDCIYPSWSSNLSWNCFYFWTGVGTGMEPHHSRQIAQIVPSTSAKPRYDYQKFWPPCMVRNFLSTRGIL
ncbi:hypothetical protein CC2G_012158 [Coprinopsis cinerea AmutBmut pab1-1]|nr:hypothetical protein CC2G_012158 [Coprinopsis cinerea AmutBmut pab1-1]